MTGCRPPEKRLQSKRKVLITTDGGDGRWYSYGTVVEIVASTATYDTQYVYAQLWFDNSWLISPAPASAPEPASSRRPSPRETAGKVTVFGFRLVALHQRQTPAQPRGCGRGDDHPVLIPLQNPLAVP